MWRGLAGGRGVAGGRGRTGDGGVAGRVDGAGPPGQRLQRSPARSSSQEFSRDAVESTSEWRDRSRHRFPSLRPLLPLAGGVAVRPVPSPWVAAPVVTYTASTVRGPPCGVPTTAWFCKNMVPWRWPGPLVSLPPALGFSHEALCSSEAVAWEL